jgi:hypothetical protein
VQTGGHGSTWKRYVDPSSDNGLYHGTISLPGVTNGLTELRFSGPAGSGPATQPPARAMAVAASMTARRPCGELVKRR